MSEKGTQHKLTKVTALIITRPIDFELTIVQPPTIRSPHLLQNGGGVVSRLIIIGQF